MVSRTITRQSDLRCVGEEDEQVVKGKAGFLQGTCLSSCLQVPALVSP